jgi:hypothetical protein
MGLLANHGCNLSLDEMPMDPKIFDCFLYHNEAYMLYLHLLTLSPVVDRFVIGHSNQSFTCQIIAPISLDPFEPEIRAFSSQITFLYIDYDHLPMGKSRFRDEIAWHREATARNLLIEGVRPSKPSPRDLILLCDVDEIVTRAAIKIIRQKPPRHYCNLQGVQYFYSFRWRVREWKRPLVIRFGSVCRPLDDYRFMPYLCPLPGILHYHCSFCFPDLRSFLVKVKSFSHKEWSVDLFHDPNYILARIACGYPVRQSTGTKQKKLTLVEFDSRNVFLPNDARFDFLKDRMGFRDLAQFRFNMTRVRKYLPSDCRPNLRNG